MKRQETAGVAWKRAKGTRGRPSTWIVASFLLVTCASRATGDPPIPSGLLVYGGNDSASPFEYLDSRGNPQGFNVELVRAP